MKTLKIKLGLFSLLAVLAVSVFLTSCEQQMEDITTTENINIPSEKAFVLPKGLDNENEEAISAFMKNITEEQMTVLEENHAIASYLIDNKLYAKIYGELSEGQLFTDVNLDTYLSSDEMADLSNYTSPNIESRGCSWHYTGNIGHYLEQHPHYCHLRHYHCSYFDNHCQCYATYYYYRWSC